MTSRQFFGVAAFAGLLALDACRSASTHVYTLLPFTPVTPSQASSDTHPVLPLRVDTVHVPSGWDRVEILSPGAGGEIKINEFAHWAAPLAQVVRQVLSADLSVRMPAGAVIYPHLPKPSDARGVSVDILQFTGASAQASISASWIITTGSSSPAGKRNVATFSVPLTSDDPPAMARAWSELVGQLADRISADATAGDGWPK